MGQYVDKGKLVSRVSLFQTGEGKRAFTFPVCADELDPFLPNIFIFFSPYSCQQATSITLITMYNYCSEHLIVAELFVIIIIIIIIYYYNTNHSPQGDHWFINWAAFCHQSHLSQ